MTLIKTKKKAIQLRQGGYSYNLISTKLKVPKSTLHYWLAEIPYTPNDIVVKRIGNALAKAGQVKHKKKLETFKKASKLAKTDIGILSKRDLFMLGIALYIGEGEKNENIGVINSDPRIIRLAIRWLREICDLKMSNFTLAVHLYPDSSVKSCLRFWSKETGIPIHQFKKTQVDMRRGKLKGKRGKLPYGTAHLRVKSNGNKDFGVLLSRRIHAWMDIVLD